MIAVKETRRKMKIFTFHFLIDASMMLLFNGFWTIKPVKFWVYLWCTTNCPCISCVFLCTFQLCMHCDFLLRIEQLFVWLVNSYLLFAETLVWIVECLYSNNSMLSFNLLVVDIVILCSKSFFIICLNFLLYCKPCLVKLLWEGKEKLWVKSGGVPALSVEPKYRIYSTISRSRL